jgi:hypothetical protein
MEPPQRVRDLPAQAERGQAHRPAPEVPAERLGVPVVEPDGQRVGEVTNAAALLEENVPRVVVGLDEEVRRRYRLDASAVDIESRFLRKEDDGTVRLLEPLQEVLRNQGFDV